VLPQPPTLRRRSAARCATVAAAWLAALALSTGTAPARAATTPPATPACGAVVLTGVSWLGGRGVDVHYNTHVNGSTASCAGFSVANLAVQYGGGWQCIELAARLYYVLGWGTVYAGKDGGAQYIPEGSPSLQFFANGSGYVPVPGDLVVEWGGTWGHTSVVNSVSATAINAVEQNVGVTAWHTYPFTGGIATGAYSTKGVRGFMHSPLNGAVRPAPVVPAAPSAPGIPKLVPKHRKVKLAWNQPRSSATIASYQIWVRTYSSGGRLNAGRVITLGSASYTAVVTGLSHSKRYRFNVRAGSQFGNGNWSNGRNGRPLK
jgi:hypothetical protein